MEHKTTNNLQYNLENILRLLTKRYNVLSKKLPKTVNSPDKKEDKSKILDFGERRLSVSDVRPYKKTKLSSEKTQKFSNRAKCKMTQPAKSQEFGFPEKSSDVPKPVKDSPNRFWTFMDCYCSDINMEDVKVLEKWIESHENDSEYQILPELGTHYTSKWLEEDILEERKEGTKSMENPKGTDFSSDDNTLESELFKKVQEKFSVESDQPPLLERLISSLVHENIISSPNDVMTESIPEDIYQESRMLEKTSNLDLNCNALENRLKSQFIEHGILEPDLNEMENDELLLELKKLQALLIPVTQYNQQKKETLLTRAKNEISKQESQKRIQEADAKIMENYRAVAAARSKGKKLNKKELSQIRIILDEREKLIKFSRMTT